MHFLAYQSMTMALVLVVGQRFADAGSLTQGRELNEYLLTNYNTDVRPTTDQSKPMNVSIDFYLRSIQELNELTDEFVLTGAFRLNWQDEGILWNPTDYGGISHTYISSESVWVPHLVLMTSSGTIDTFVKKWQRVLYFWDGVAVFVVGDRMKASCSIDVEKYPFDKQVCTLVIQAWGYEYIDVQFSVAAKSAYTHQFSENSQWELEKTELSATNIDGWAALEMSLYLKRRAGFTIISLLAPLLLMGVLNLFVFVLVPDSGERVSYSITVLLAIAVFMTIVSDNLPNSSEPVPLITYKLMVDLATSVSITLVTIINLGVYQKDDNIRPVQGYLRAFYVRLCCKGRKGNVVHVAAEKDARTIASSKSRVPYPKSSNRLMEPEPEVTWKNISALIDYISLVVFSIASILSFVVYTIKVAS